MWFASPAGHSSSPCQPSSRGCSAPPPDHPQSPRSSAPDASCPQSGRSYSDNTVVTGALLAEERVGDTGAWSKGQGEIVFSDNAPISLENRWIH